MQSTLRSTQTALRAATAAAFTLWLASAANSQAVYHVAHDVSGNPWAPAMAQYSPEPFIDEFDEHEFHQLSSDTYRTSHVELTTTPGEFTVNTWLWFTKLGNGNKSAANWGTAEVTVDDLVFSHESGSSGEVAYRLNGKLDLTWSGTCELQETGLLAACYDSPCETGYPFEIFAGGQLILADPIAAGSYDVGAPTYAPLDTPVTRTIMLELKTRAQNTLLCNDSWRTVEASAVLRFGEVQPDGRIGPVFTDHSGTDLAALGYRVDAPSIGLVDNYIHGPATEVVRLGTPPNPNVLLPGQTSGPILGQAWDPVVDHTSFVTDAVLDMWLYSGGVANLPNPGASVTGTFLLQVDALMLAFLSIPQVSFLPPGLPGGLLLPPDPSLIGLELHVQVLSGRIDGSSLSWEATNALDTRIGLY